MLVSFDNKFIRQDQKQYRNGEACRASDTFLVEPNKLHIKKTFTGTLWFCLSCSIVRYGIKSGKEMKIKHESC